MQALKIDYIEKYRVEDYEQWQGDWELIYGDAYAMSPSLRLTHQIVSLQIARQLDEQLEECQTCRVTYEMDWNVSDDTVVRPDVMVICNQSGERVVKAPVIIFEVTSKQSARRDEILKFELYRMEGVKFYGIAYPEYKKVRFYELLNGEYQKRGDFTDEKYVFELTSCSIEFDFNKIWRRS